MMVARGVLTSRGGKTSHAAVVARGMGRTCVCGAEALDVDTREGEFTVRGGRTDPGGRRHLHRRHHRRGLRRRGAGRGLQRGAPLRGRRDRRTRSSRRCPGSWSTPTALRRLRVRTNADTAPDAARARRFGAQGIGLCRTEHMFLGERRQLVENLIVAEDEAGQEEALAELLPLQRKDFTGDLRGDGRTAGHDPPHRPAPARVPPGHHRALRLDGGGGRPGAPQEAAAPAPRRGPAAARVRTRCWDCAAYASASSSRASSPCRPARSSRRPPSASATAVGPSRRS